MSTKISVNFYLSDFDSSNKNEFNLENVFVCKIDKNIFVQTAVTLYDREDMKNDTL